MFDWRWPFEGRRGAAVAETKDSRAGALIALTGAGRPRWTPRDYAQLADEGFGKNPVVYRCVRMIAEAAAATPLVVFAEGVRVEDHPLARLLARPNAEQSGAEFLEGLYGALQTAGNAYVEGVGEGPPEELWSLRPDRVKVVPGRGGWPQGYDYSVHGRSVVIGRAGDGWMPVMHLKLFHPTDDHYGQSPLEAAAFAIDVHNASGAWNKALLDNAARPSGALVYGARDGERMTAEQFEMLKSELAHGQAGTANAGRPLILEGGLDWKPMSWTPAEMDFIAGKHAAAREIALAFGVPPQLLGIPGDATYANYREANTAFWRGTVVPLVRKTAGALTAWLGARFAGVRIEADLDAVPALQPEREALWARLNAAGFLTDEERRRMAGVEGWFSFPPSLEGRRAKLARVGKGAHARTPHPGGFAAVPPHEGEGESEIMSEHQTKRVPTALLIALAAQAVAGLVWAGGAAARIGTLETRVAEQRLVAERLARLEEQSTATRAAVERIERRLEAVG